MQESGIIEAVAKLQAFFPDIPLTFANLYKYVDNYMCLKAMGKPFLPIF